MHGHQEHPKERTAKSATTRAVGPERGPAPGPDAVLALQRLVGNAAVSDLLGDAEEAERQSASVHEVLRSPGRPLDDSVRTDMEATLGADFSDVRVHTDRAAHESATSVAAQAYTSGSHIVFQQGRYDPASDAGREVLAHELAHVVQQRRGPVAGTDGGLAISDPSDPFEREAERVAAGAQVSPATTPDAGAGLPVARLMSVADFRRMTKVGLLEKRGSSIERVEQALAAYHQLPQTSYLARYQQLRKLMTAAENYSTQSKSKRHQTVVDDLVTESHTESTDIRIPAVIEEILQQVAAHAQIYQQLTNAEQEADPLTKARGLLTAQEAILGQIQATNAGADSDLTHASANLATWLIDVVNHLSEDYGRQLVDDDLRRLESIQADPNAPQITRNILNDLLGRRGMVKFTTGMPGTKLNPAGSAEKYTLKHMLTQPAGATERLGSLAHELTHVDAGETYANTEILLLARKDLNDDDIRDLARDRSAEIDQLKKTAAQSQALTAEQKRLVESKLQYAVDPMKGVGRYAVNFKSRIDDDTYRRLMHIETLSSPNSSALVEYDTVITQLLIYLHRWGVDQQEPLYVAVMQLAAQLRNDRLAAAATP